MSMDMDKELLKAFFVEAEDIIVRITTDVKKLEKNPTDLEIINALFRGVHTIKGNSSFLSLDNITKVSHLCEDMLDRARNKKLEVTKDVLLILRKVADDLLTMIQSQDHNLDISVSMQVLTDFLAGKPNATAPWKGEAEPEVEEEHFFQPAAGASVGSNFVRIEENKIAKVISLVNELELLRYGLEDLPTKLESMGKEFEDLRFEVDLQVSKLSRLTKSLNGIVYGVRLVPVKQVFQRFPRVVKDLATKLGKKMRLEVVNGEAQLDKNIVEAISEPMTHLIRNSADHGIESIQDRIAAGKDQTGVIRLNSYVRGTFVFIEIVDDGKGIDGDKVLQKAVEKGIVPLEKSFSFTDAQKLALIFAPGFSTAEKVTEISGRGVGMDVVKSNINKLKGTVIIDSTVGKGTKILLRFPMSMAVMFSLFFYVKDVLCAFPMEEVEESFDFKRNEVLSELPDGADASQYLKLISLKELIWENIEDRDRRKSYQVIRLRDLSGKMYGFIVDDFSAIEEAVIQSVDSYIAALPGIQGATVRKDGSVALMLNVTSVIELSKRWTPLGYAKIPEKNLDFIPDTNLSLDVLKKLA